MLRNYILLAWRVLQRRVFFTAVSLFGIAFTIAMLVIATALFDQALAPVAPEVNQSRTLGLYYAEMSGETMSRNGFAGYALIDKHARGLPGVERVGIASTPARVTTYQHGAPEKLYLKRTDADFWRVTKFEFLEGGPYGEQDLERGSLVAVINASTRARLFGQAAGVVGRDFEADGQRFRVAGVVPDVSMLRLVSFADVWVPLTSAKSDAYRSQLVGDFMAILLMEPGADPEAIRDEFRSRLARIEFPDPRGFNTISAVPESLLDTIARMLFGRRGTDTRYGQRLLISLVLAAALFMVLPAVNLVNLNISRIMERAPEIGVRKAFGASSWTLVGQFLVENLILTLVGSVVGTLLAVAGLWLINGSGVIPYAQLAVNLRVLAWGVAFAVAFGVASGVYPAWRMSRLHPADALKGVAR